jgi:hypothetical protein
MATPDEQLQLDNAFEALKMKAIENLTRLICASTTAEFTVLQNFILNWTNYIISDPSVDPSGSLTYILTNNNELGNNYNSYNGTGIGGIGDGIWDEIQYGKTNLIINNIYNTPYYYPFYFFTYITALKTSDASYTIIVEFFNQLIAL